MCVIATPPGESEGKRVRALGNTCGRQTFTQFEFGAAEVHREGTTAAVPLPRGRRRDLEAHVGERTRCAGLLSRGKGGSGRFLLFVYCLFGWMIFMCCLVSARLRFAALYIFTSL